MTRTQPDAPPAAADPDQPMHAHLMCGTCHPNGAHLGDQAVCGEAILNTGAGDRPHCPDCTHIDHTGRKPCGH